MPGCRPRNAATKDADGSIAETAPGSARRSSSSVRAPVPDPMSTTLIPVATPAKSANGAERSRDHRPMNASYASDATLKLTPGRLAALAALDHPPFARGGWVAVLRY